MDKWSHRRAVLAAVLIAAMAATLTSCTVPQRGLTGVRLDAEGRLTAVLAWCPGKVPDGFTLHTDAGKPELEINFRAPKLSGTYAEVGLSEPPPGWTASVRLPDLDPQRKYRLYGWTTDNSSSTRGVTFTLAELRAQQDSILMQGEYDKKSDSWPNVHLSADEFRAAVDRIVAC
jgi:hypothetical protein